MRDRKRVVSDKRRQGREAEGDKRELHTGRETKGTKNTREDKQSGSRRKGSTKELRGGGRREKKSVGNARANKTADAPRPTFRRQVNRALKNSGTECETRRREKGPKRKRETREEMPVVRVRATRGRGEDARMRR